MMEQYGMNRRTAYILYTCHALSTWNARSYEFAVVIFTAAAYPGNLRATSFLGITNSLATICFASALGRWIDHAPSRLRTLVTTIAFNRSAVTASCFFWFFIISEPASEACRSSSSGTGSPQDCVRGDGILDGVPKLVTFIVILFLGIVENLSRKANVLSIERDWVPVLAPPSLLETSLVRNTLAHVNAVMARIDVICKLAAPLVISGFVSVVSLKLAVLSLAVVNLLSFSLEILTAKSVWSESDALREPKPTQIGDVDLGLLVGTSNASWISTVSQMLPLITTWWWGFIDSFKLYFSSEVWVPSLAMTMTHSSILSVTGVLIVFLLNSGYALKVITVAEAGSVLFELGGTYLTPFLISKLSTSMLISRSRLLKMVRLGRQDALAAVPIGDDPLRDISGMSPSDDVIIEPIDTDIDAAAEATADDKASGLNLRVSQVGFLGISSMFISLIPTLPIILYLTSTLSYPIPQSSSAPTFYAYPIISVIFLFCLAASRLGRAMLSLTTQQLSQSRVPALQRSNFAGTELALVSVFGLMHNIGAAIWSQPKEFGWLSLVSLLAVGASAGLYSWWMRRSNEEVGEWKWWKRRAHYSAVAQEL